MDKFWSIFAFPIGLTICFGPVLVVWVRQELRDARKASKPATQPVKAAAPVVAEPTLVSH